MCPMHCWSESWVRSIAGCDHKTKINKQVKFKSSVWTDLISSSMPFLWSTSFNSMSHNCQRYPKLHPLLISRFTSHLIHPLDYSTGNSTFHTWSSHSTTHYNTHPELAFLLICPTSANNSTINPNKLDTSFFLHNPALCWWYPQTCIFNVTVFLSQLH